MDKSTHETLLHKCKLMKRKIIEQKEKLTMLQEEKQKLAALVESFSTAASPDLHALKQNYIELKAAFERQSTLLTQDYILRETHQAVLKDKELAVQARIDLLRLEIDAEYQRRLDLKTHEFSQTLALYTRQIQELKTPPRPAAAKATQSYSPSLSISQALSCSAENSRSQAVTDEVQYLRSTLAAASRLHLELAAVHVSVKTFLQQWLAEVETQCRGLAEQCQQWLVKKSTRLDKAWTARVYKLEQCIRDEDYLWIDEPGLEGVREGLQLLVQSKAQLIKQRDFFQEQLRSLS